MVGVRNPVWRSQKSQRGVVLAALGSRDEAVRLVEEDLAAARDWGTPELVGRTLRILGELGTADRVDVLREAVDLLEQRHDRGVAELLDAVLVHEAAVERPHLRLRRMVALVGGRLLDRAAALGRFHVRLRLLQARHERGRVGLIPP